MTPANVPIEVRRNGDYAETWVVADDQGYDENGDAVSPQDLTGWTLAMQVRLYGLAGGSSLITLATVTTAVQGLRIVEATAGQIEARITDATLEALPVSGKAGESVTFKYDLLLTDPTGLEQVYAEGDFIVYPGVTR
jgi:hypothetical protein